MSLRTVSAAHSLFQSTVLSGACLLTLVFSVSCAKDEPPPPLPEPKAATSAAAPFTLTPEDAGLDAGKKEEEKKGTGKRAPSESLANCCAALKQNAASAPEPTKTYMLQAAQQCEAAASIGQGKDGALAVIRGVLKGASLPAGCR